MMPGNYPESDIKCNIFTRLVGRLYTPIPQQANKPWSNASCERRSRVYGMRQRRGDRVYYYSIDGKALMIGIFWETTVQNNAWNLWHDVGTLMDGPSRHLPHTMAAHELARKAESFAVRAGWRPLMETLRNTEELHMDYETLIMYQAYKHFQAFQLEVEKTYRRKRARPEAEPAPALPALPVVASTTPTCSVCLDALAGTVFPACGHRCACVACARKCNNKCPICRKVSRPVVIYDA